MKMGARRVHRVHRVKMERMRMKCPPRVLHHSCVLTMIHHNLRFKRPGRTIRVRNSVSQNFVFATTSPALERAATIAAAAREHNIRQLPALITNASIECQHLLEELAAIKAEERARERARRLQAEQEAMRVLNALAHCWRRKKFRKRYYKRKSVTRLQSKFRGNIARKKFVRNVMCRKIQAKHRGKMDRRRALAWKMKVFNCT